MCDGRSCPSWTISSARSVSQASMPSRASASLSSISWVAIDLTLTTSVAPAVADDAGDDRVRLGGVARPVDDAARGRHRALELLEQRRQVAQDVVLDRRARPGAAPPSRRARPTARARLVADRRGRAAEVGPELLVGEGGAGRLRERRRPGEGRLGPVAAGAAGAGGHGCRRGHAAAPVEARISARCITRTGEPRRDSRPPRCIRHEVSPAVRTSAPDASDGVDLVERPSRPTCRRS